MPELPEVETIRRQLEPQLTGSRIAGLRVADPRITAPVSPRTLAARVKGKKVMAVRRRGKYLRLELSGGGILVLHLRMTGVVTFTEAPVRRYEWPHLRLVVEFAGGGRLVFQDQRRFGTATYVPAPEVESYFSRLGLEPLEHAFNAAALRRLANGRLRPVKSFLLDQSIIAGIGNIYADEALYRAGIHPLRPAGSLSEAELALLTRAIKATLREAIRLQGSSIDTYQDSRGRRGRFQETFRVHRREGLPCTGCCGLVEKIRVGGRGTYFCPRCQK